MSINLLPQEIIAKRRSEKRLIFLGLATIILVLLMVFTFLSLNWKVGQEEEQLMKIKDEKQKVNSEIGKYKIYEERQVELQKKRDILNSAMSDEVAWDKFLNEVSMVIPSNVWLESLSMSADGINYAGYTFDFPSVAKWLIRLDEIKSLENIWFTHASRVELTVGDPETNELIYEVVQFNSTSNLLEEQADESASSENSSEESTEEGDAE